MIIAICLYLIRSTIVYNFFLLYFVGCVFPLIFMLLLLFFIVTVFCVFFQRNRYISIDHVTMMGNMGIVPWRLAMIFTLLLAVEVVTCHYPRPRHHRRFKTPYYAGFWTARSNSAVMRVCYHCRLFQTGNNHKFSLPVTNTTRQCSIELTLPVSNNRQPRVIEHYWF